MNATCCSETVKNRSAAAESLGIKAARLADALEDDVRAFVRASDENLGHIELQIEQQSRELLRAATEKAAQKKADAAGLSGVSEGLEPSQPRSPAELRVQVWNH